MRESPTHARVDRRSGFVIPRGGQGRRRQPAPASLLPVDELQLAVDRLAAIIIEAYLRELCATSEEPDGKPS